MKKPLLALLLLAACSGTPKKRSSSVDQSIIETVYGITYYESGTEGAASVRFNVEEKGQGLVQLELDGKSSVTFNGKKLRQQTVPILGGVYYNIENLAFQSENMFVYTDNNGKVYTNKITMQPVSVTSLVKADSSGRMRLEISRALEANETMRVDLDGEGVESSSVTAQAEDETANGYYDSATRTFVFLPDYEHDLQKSKTLNAVVHIEKREEQPQQVPAAGGSLHVIYVLNEQRFSR